MGDAKNEANSDDVAKALELELVIKRLEWQRSAEKRRAARTLSFVFLALVIVGALVSFMFFMSQLQGRREQQKAGIEATPAP